MHDLNEWRDREGNLIGASVFLTPDEVDKVRSKGSIQITVDEIQD